MHKCKFESRIIFAEHTYWQKNVLKMFLNKNINTNNNIRSKNKYVSRKNSL